MNVRRIASVVALTGAIALSVAPAAGAAVEPDYPTVEGALTCSATAVAPFTDFTCTVTAPEGSDVTLAASFPGNFDVTIAGTTSFERTVPAGAQSVDFTLTSPGALGTISITATAPGVVIEGASNVDVVAFAPEGPTDNGGGGLAFTGADNMGLVFAAGGLLLAGALAVTVAGRRRVPARG